MGLVPHTHFVAAVAYQAVQLSLPCANNHNSAGQLFEDPD